MDALCDYRVTSRVIKGTMNGFYPYEYSELMIPHETIRAELRKGSAAMNAFDVKTHPWKAECFASWFRYLLAPLVQLHQHFDLDVMYPFYSSLGAEIPGHVTSNLKSMKTSLDLMARRVEAVAAKVKSNPGSDESADYGANLQNDYRTWAEELEVYFAEEERVWPAIYKQFGEVR